MKPGRVSIDGNERFSVLLSRGINSILVLHLVPTLKSVDEYLVRSDYLNETSSALLSHDTDYLVCTSNFFWVCRIRPWRATSLFSEFLRTPPFFSALIVIKAVLFVQVARHFPIHHDAYPTCVFFFLWESWSTLSDTSVSLFLLWRKQNT